MDPGDGLIYLDNAATVFPKLKDTLRQALETYLRLGVSPGRGGYDLAMMAQELVADVREQLSTFFGSDDPERVIFAANASDALNLAIQGLIEPGCHVVSTRLEHNSVLRPLHHFQKTGILTYDLVPGDGQGFVDPDDIARAIRPETRMVIVNHASNVIGALQDAEAIGAVCKQRGVPLVLDVAQSAGIVPIRMRDWGISAVAFTGHKSLMGPAGIGGLVLADGFDVRTTRFGGTGVESRSLEHTQTYPHRLEVGTGNLPGILGLSGGLKHLESVGMETVRTREIALAKHLAEGLSEIPSVQIYGPSDWERRTPVILCNVRNMEPDDVGAILDGDYGIAVRTGLHCAPLMHQDLKTFPEGGVRFSVGPANTMGDIEEAIAAMAEIGKHK